jgi:hypothetical protein
MRSHSPALSSAPARWDAAHHVGVDPQGELRVGVAQLGHHRAEQRESLRRRRRRGARLRQASAYPAHRRRRPDHLDRRLDVLGGRTARASDDLRVSCRPGRRAAIGAGRRQWPGCDRGRYLCRLQSPTRQHYLAPFSMPAELRQDLHPRYREGAISRGVNSISVCAYDYAQTGTPNAACESKEVLINNLCPDRRSEAGTRSARASQAITRATARWRSAVAP